MTRGILIAGAESSLSAALAAEAGKRVEHFATAFIPDRLGNPVRERQEPAGGAAFRLSWNPGSPISARSLILAAQNRLGRIDEAFLVCTPPSVRQAAELMAPGDIETLVNDHIKGWFFLAKELSALFAARQGGTLALVLSDISAPGNREDPVDLMGPSVAASFRAFATGLLSLSYGKAHQTLAFSSDAGEDPGFAAFIFKLVDEGSRRDAGKWHKYGKLGFFGR
jgi:NAD(P)-dependent dehydrogenase (short-subunit alcohol dehydrogenase family)